MAIQREVTFYKASELKGRARQKAIEHGRDCRNEDFDVDSFTEMLKEKLVDKFGIGGDDIKLAWSLSYCQGDGVGIYGRPDLDKLLAKDADIKRLVDKLLRIDVMVAVNSEKTNHHYDHWNSMTLHVEGDSGWRYNDRYVNASIEKMEAYENKLLNELEEMLQDHFKSASRHLESIGYAALEIGTEDDDIIAMLDEMEAWFLSSGRRCDPDTI